MADIQVGSDEQQFLAHALLDIGAVEGLLKVKLIHAQGFSLLMPDLLLMQGTERWQWLQPKFFTACLMHFLEEFSTAALWLDPRDDGPQLMIRFSSGQFVRRFADGSHLYRCVISGAEDLQKLAAGACVVTEAHDVLLDLFHHTTAESKQAIEASGHFGASSWNVQGTKRLQNVGYTYFTSPRWPLQIPPPMATQIPPGRTAGIMSRGWPWPGARRLPSVDSSFPRTPAWRHGA